MVVAASFWGFGFTATVWALEVLSAFQLTFLRFAIAGGVGAVYIMARKPEGAWKDNLRLTFWPAVFLLGTLTFQTWGMHYTTVAKSGFITTLYVVFVPLLEAAVSRRRLPWTLWACVAAALAGTVMIVGGKISDFNFGDFLVFICAVLATLQIHILGIVSPRVTQPFIFNIVQSCWCALFMLPVLVLEPVHEKVANVLSWPPLAIAGVLILAFGSTIFAFYLQVRAQSKISTTVSSLLFLLESPFALLFAMLLLKEQLAPIQATGAAVIFLSAMFASLIEGRRKKF
jgi:drug/metabolite transporter (DMT)-like permease